MRFLDTPLLWTAEEVYTPTECAAWIDRIEAADPRIATNNPLYRDQDRVMFDDAEAAEELCRRLEPHLPERVGGLRRVGLNDRLRCYRYAPGQRFSEHMDHWYQPTPTRITLLTVLVYLNDSRPGDPGGFEGGETRFSEQLDKTLVPRSGLVALFQHKLRHEGCPVTRGTKYLIRTDVLYEAPSPIRLTYEGAD